MTIAIVDYGMGNLGSVRNALAEISSASDIVSDPSRLADYDRIILPGVGAFGEAIETLERSGMAAALHAFVKSGKPVLGVCLGMQLICSKSFEEGEHRGLDWIDADVVPFDPSLGVKVPHMGWNTLIKQRSHPLFGDSAPGSDVYFVHSYLAECRDPDHVIATCQHGIEFAAVIARDNVIGMQFHPEKSQSVGLNLLRHFAGS